MEGSITETHLEASEAAIFPRVQMSRNRLVVCLVAKTCNGRQDGGATSNGLSHGPF